MNTNMYIYTHIHNYAHIHFQTYMYQNMCVYAVGVGFVVGWCGVVWCVDVLLSLSLVFSNLKLVRSKGLLLVNL